MQATCNLCYTLLSEVNTETVTPVWDNSCKYTPCIWSPDFISDLRKAAGTCSPPVVYCTVLQCNTTGNSLHTVHCALYTVHCPLGCSAHRLIYLVDINLRRHIKSKHITYTNRRKKQYKLLRTVYVNCTIPDKSMQATCNICYTLLPEVNTETVTPVWDNSCKGIPYIWSPDFISDLRKVAGTSNPPVVYRLYYSVTLQEILYIQYTVHCTLYIVH